MLSESGFALGAGLRKKEKPRKCGVNSYSRAVPVEGYNNHQTKCSPDEEPGCPNSKFSAYRWFRGIDSGRISVLGLFFVYIYLYIHLHMRTYTHMHAYRGTTHRTKAEASVGEHHGGARKQATAARHSSSIPLTSGAGGAHGHPVRMNLETGVPALVTGELRHQEAPPRAKPGGGRAPTTVTIYQWRCPRWSGGAEILTVARERGYTRGGGRRRVLVRQKYL